MEKLGANYSAAKLFRAYASADPKPAPRDVAEFSRRAERPAGAGRALADHRRRPGRRHGVDGARQPAAEGAPIQRSHGCLRAGLPDLSVRDVPPQQGLRAARRRALRRGRPGLRALPDQPDAPRADEAREAQLRAREHMGGREATITGVAESQRLVGEGEALYKAGKFADALQAFERAYSLNPLADSALQPGGVPGEDGRVREGRLALRAVPEGSPAGTRCRSRCASWRPAARRGHQGVAGRIHPRAGSLPGGRLQGAASAFPEAHSHLPSPEFLFNQGEALSKAGDVQGAVRAFQQYLNAAPDAPDAGKVRERSTGCSRPAAARWRSRWTRSAERS